MLSMNVGEPRRQVAFDDCSARCPVSSQRCFECASHFWLGRVFEKSAQPRKSRRRDGGRRITEEINRWLRRRCRVGIVGVVSGGSADQAGLKAGTERAYLGNMPIMLGGDLIVAIDDQKIEDQDDLSQMMNNHRAGDTVKITIYRGKTKMDVKVSLGEARQQV